MNILQGEIWWIKLDENPIGHEQGGTRPFFIISKDEYNKNSKTPMGFSISKSLHKSKNKFSIEIEYIDLKNNKKNIYVNISQLRTLSIERFNNKIGRCLSFKDIQKIMNTYYNNIII